MDLYDYQHRLRILSIAKYLRNQPWDPALRNYECWCESLRPHTQKKNNSPKDPLPQQWLKQSIFRVVQFISRAVQSIFRAGQSIFQVGDMASLLSSLTASSLSVIAYCWDLTKGIEANLILLIEKYFRSLFALLLCLPVVFFYYQFQKNVQKLSEEDESSPAAFTPTPPLPFFGKAHRR